MKQKAFFMFSHVFSFFKFFLEGESPTLNNLNMQNSMVICCFLFLKEIRFLSKFGPKIQNVQFKLKFGT